MSQAIRARLKAGQPLLTVNPGGVALPVVDALADAGVDVLFIDCERTAVSVESVPVMARAAQARGMGALVRSPTKDPAFLTRYLDCRIDGLVLPQVEHAAQCADLCAVAHATGRREELLLVAQIESVAGIERLDEIAAVEDIDLFLIGPNDLSHSMGLNGNARHPDVEAAVIGIANRLGALGRAFGLPVTAATASQWVGRGALLLYTGLGQLLAPSVAALKGAMPRPAASVS